MFQMYGVVPPMCTPFKENGELDVDSLKELVTFLRDRVNGLFICGSYGGGALMTEEERKKVTEVTIDTVQGKIPVIVHVGTADSLSASRLTDHAINAGAAAVAAVTAAAVVTDKTYRGQFHTAPDIAIVMQIT